MTRANQQTKTAKTNSPSQAALTLALLIHWAFWKVLFWESRWMKMPDSNSDYAWHFPWFLILCEERGKKWNSLSRNEENSRNFFTSNEHLIYPKKCTKNLQKFFLQKSAIFFVKGTQFSTPQTIFMHKFFSDIKFCIFLQFLRPILAKKTFILGWWIPCFPCLFSLWGIPCHQIPWFLIPHEEMPCVFGALDNVRYILSC